MQFDDETMLWMANCLKQALTRGAEDWADDTVSRAAWLEEEQARHVLAGTVLVGCMAYAESKLGKRWWQQIASSAASRDLDLLNVVRHAFVHSDSIPENLEHRVHKERASDIEKYCADLAGNKIKDDKGNVYPVYVRWEGGRIIFGVEAIHVLERIFFTAYKNFR